MQTQFRGKHFVTLRDWTREEIDTLLDVSLDLKRDFALGHVNNMLENQTIFLMFMEQSTRTRNSMKPASPNWAVTVTSSMAAPRNWPTAKARKIPLSS